MIDRWASIGDLFNPRTPAFWLVVAGMLVFVARLLRRRTPLAEAGLWAWALVALLFLAWHSPLHYNHLVALPVPLAIAAAVSLGAEASALRGRARTVAVLALVALAGAGFGQQWRRLGVAFEVQSAAEVAAAQELLRVTAPGDLVATDLPVAAVLAHRLVPGPLVDAAYLRFETGSLTSARVLAVIDARCVQAVVAGRSYTRQPAIMTGLRDRFARSASRFGVTVFSSRRAACGSSRSAV